MGSQFHANLKDQPLLSGIPALHQDTNASFECLSGTGCFWASAALLSCHTYLYLDCNEILAMLEIVVNLLTCSLGFSPTKSKVPTAVLCSRRSPFGLFVLSTFPGATALTSSTPKGNYRRDGAPGEQLGGIACPRRTCFAPPVTLLCRLHRCLPSTRSTAAQLPIPHCGFFFMVI